MSKDFRERAYLTRGITLTAIDERSGNKTESDTISKEVSSPISPTQSSPRITRRYFFCTDNLVDSVSVEVAMQYRREDYSEHPHELRQ